MRKSSCLIATPPGATIQEQLEIQEMSFCELAQKTGINSKHLRLLMNGDVAISANEASLLEKALNVPASFWLKLDKIYQGKLKKIQQENNIRAS